MNKEPWLVSQETRILTSTPLGFVSHEDAGRILCEEYRVVSLLPLIFLLPPSMHFCNDEHISPSPCESSSDIPNSIKLK